MKSKYLIFVLMLLLFYSPIRADDVWADYSGTSSTSGTWDTGTRFNPNVSIKPSFVLLWSKQFWNGGISRVTYGGWNQATISNGTIYFGEGTGTSSSSDPGYLWAWDSATGVTKTGFPLTATYGAVGAACIRDNYLSIGTQAPYMSAGTALAYVWDTITLNPVLGFPVMVENSTIAESSTIIKDNRIYISNDDLTGTANYFFYCFNVLDGSLIYKNPLPAFGTASTCAIYKGKIVQNCYATKQIMCFNESDGSSVAGYPVSGVGGGLSSPIVYNDRIFIGSDKFYAVDINTATQPAPFPLTTTGGIQGINCTAAAGYGNVYFGNASGYLYGIKADTGEYLPGFPVYLDNGFGGGIDGHIALANGVVYAGTWMSDKVFAVDAFNGTVLWEYALGGGAPGGYMSISVAENKLVVVSGKSNGIFVFVEPSPTVTSTPTETVTDTSYPTATESGTYTQTLTPSVTVTITPSTTETETPSMTQSVTETLSATITPTESITVQASDTMTPTPSQTATPTSTYTFTRTITPTPSISATVTVLPCGDGSEILSFPNPYKSIEGFNLHLDLCFISDVNVKIYTGSFRKIMDKTYMNVLTNQNLNIANEPAIEKLASGIYYAVVTVMPKQGSGFVTKRKVLMLVVLN